MAKKKPRFRHKDVAIRAYALWERRGRPFGSPELDWFQAESELANADLSTKELGSFCHPNGQVHPDAIKHMRARLIRVAELAEKSSLITVDWHKDVFIASGLIAYVLKGACLDQYRQLLTEMHKLPGWADRFSESFIDGSLQSILRSALDKNSPVDAGAQLETFVLITHAFDIEHTVYLPIQSLSLQIPELIVGNVKFLKVTDVLLSAVLEGTNTTKEHFFSRSPIYTIAELRFVAERERARERAEGAVRDAIEVLVYAMACVVRPALLLTPGLQNDAVFGSRVAVVKNPGPNGYYVSGSIVGQPFDISNEIWAAMQASGIGQLSTLLRATERSEYEKALLRAVHWFALAHQQQHRTTRVLALTTVFETMLSKGKGAGLIAATIAEGVAFVLGGHYAERKAIRDQVIELYDLRSNITHGSGVDVTLAELHRLSLLARDFLFQLVWARCDLKSKSDLAAWIEKRRLS